MSRATLYVRFPDGSLRYGLYDGTGGIVWPRLYDTPDEAWEADDYSSQYKAGAGCFVDVATDYGGGKHWTATATRECVTSMRFDEDRADESEGLPDWAVYPVAPEETQQ